MNFPPPKQAWHYKGPTLSSRLLVAGGSWLLPAMYLVLARTRISAEGRANCARPLRKVAPSVDAYSGLLIVLEVGETQE